MKPIFAFILHRIKNEYFFTLVDIGAKGGIPKKWDFLSSFMRVIAFEPNKIEFNKLTSSGNITYFNCALYNKSQELKLYITKSHGCSSIYKPNIDLLSQFEDVERFHIEKVEILPPEKVRTLDSIVEENFIIDVDFIKLDTQGSELPILEGCQNCVIPKSFGIKIEVEFIEMYKNQPLFYEVDEFMHRQGFQLIDLRRVYWKRKDYCDYVGKGQLVWGDALYFKRIEVLFEDLSTLQDKSYGTSKIYKAILICLIYRMFDYAVSVAKIGFELEYLSQNEFEYILSEIRAYSKRGIVFNFQGKGRLYKIMNLIRYLLKPKAYLGWIDGEMEIGNIKDE